MKMRNYPRTWATATAYLFAICAWSIGWLIHSKVISEYKIPVAVAVIGATAMCIHIPNLVRQEGSKEANEQDQQ